MSDKRLIIGSRSSPLAMVQAHAVVDTLKKRCPSLDFEIRKIKTVGDKILDVALSRIGGKGLFTKEIEEALLRREIDLAVHSMKDLPTELPKGLVIAAVSAREDPRDVVVSKPGFSVHTLPKGAKVGTSSLRRRAQLMNIRKDLEILDLRGNLDTRIRKMESGLFDAILLAYAGIKRLGILVKLSAVSTDEIIPQAGQGALGIEMHEESEHRKEVADALDDADCRYAVDAERSLLHELEGGCQVPIGVHAVIDGEEVRIVAGVFSLDGASAVRDTISGKKRDSVVLGRELAKRIFANDIARRILRDVREGIR